MSRGGGCGMRDSERSDDQTDPAERTRLIEAYLTRRNALRAGALASSGLAYGGIASESAVASTPQTAQDTGPTNNNAVSVTWANYPRANCHAKWQSTVNDGGFGQFDHIRSPTPIDKQLALEMNRDTLYSFGVFDLTEPVTITKPDTGDPIPVDERSE